MNKNLKLLDRFDKKTNIYELICKLAERAHQILNGVNISSTTEKDPVQIAIQEFLEGRVKENE